MSETKADGVVPVPTEGKFVLRKTTSFKELANSTVTELMESDLCFQDELNIYQFKFDKPEIDPKVEIEPGIFTITESNGAVFLKKTELRTRNLLTSVTNTKSIIDEANIFFNNLDVYIELEEPQARKILIHSDPGMGKCLGIDTPILMFDGSTKLVQDVVTGDLLMGPDSTSRTVLSTVIGKEEMFDVIPNKGSRFSANRSHILSLRISGSDELVNITIDDYLKLSDSKKDRLKFWRTGVEFVNNDELSIDPYILGLWLGDGSSGKPEICSADDTIKDDVRAYFAALGLKCNEQIQENGLVAIRATTGTNLGPKDKNIFMSMLRQLSLVNNKHIPLIYKTSSRDNRLKLLAGIIDTDGGYDNGCFDVCFKNETLLDDVIYLARSLGFAAYKSVERKSAANSKNDHIDIYYRTHISGDIDVVPTKLNRKQALPRKQIKNVLRTGFVTESLGEGNYYGFTLTGDKLFLLGDFTVTHNTATITQYCMHAIEEDKGTVVLVWPTSQIDSGDVLEFLSKNSIYTKDCTRVILIIEDIGGGEREGSGSTRSVDSSLLDLLDGLQITFKLPTLIIATTNYPQNLLSALADRPGRFDLIMALKAPSYLEKLELTAHIAKRELSDEEKEAFRSPGCEGFSVAHLKEVVIRSRLHKKTIKETITQLIDHRKKFNNNFEENKGSVGFNGRDDD